MFLGYENTRTPSDFFDFENATINSSQLSDNEFIVARANNFDINNNINFVYSKFIDDNDNLIRPMIVKTEVTGVSSKIIEYLNLNSGIVAKVILEDGDIISSSTYIVDEEFYNRCGGETAACIADAYTNEGWGTVGLWVASAVWPEVAVATAVYCAIESCR